jgi:hypothetical protein
MPKSVRSRIKACETCKAVSSTLYRVVQDDTAPCAVQHELRHVRALMQLEQKEDQAQFKLKNASASIKERRHF